VTAIANGRSPAATEAIGLGARRATGGDVVLEHAVPDQTGDVHGGLPRGDTAAANGNLPELAVAGDSGAGVPDLASYVDTVRPFGFVTYTNEAARAVVALARHAPSLVIEVRVSVIAGS
jgi:hypothetical protein